MPFRTFLAAATVLGVVGAGVGGYALFSDAPGGEPVVADEDLSPSPTPTVEPSPSASPTPTDTPSGVEESPEEPSPSPSPTRQAFTYDVAAVQQKLADQRYYGGVIDGEEGPRLRSAVMAFQKVNGLTADGVVGPVTLAALENPAQPVTKASAPANRIEVDLGRQILFYVRDNRIQRIMPVSSGNGAKYRHVSGSTATALTPVGWFRIERKISGLREAPLGSLYDPMYFYKGWAIHGSNSVPAYPASHGCVRLTRWDALWLFDRAPRGMQVYLHGGAHTFTAGSSAPGTDEPAGDTSGDTSDDESPSPSPTPSGSSSPTPSPSSSSSPSPSPSPSESASPSDSTSPSESPSESPTAAVTSSPSPSENPS